MLDVQSALQARYPSRSRPQQIKTTVRECFSIQAVPFMLLPPPFPPLPNNHSALVTLWIPGPAADQGRGTSMTSYCRQRRSVYQVVVDDDL